MEEGKNVQGSHPSKVLSLNPLQLPPQVNTFNNDGLVFYSFTCLSKHEFWKQQGPTAEHKEQYSVSCDNHHEKGCMCV